MTAQATALKPLRSGFCGLGNPPDSHQRCSGTAGSHPCSCACHDVVDGSIPDVREPGLFDDVDEAAYHADRDSLSHSGAKLLLKSPAHYRWELDHPEHRDVWDFGSAAHALVLGVGMDRIYVAPYEDWIRRKGPVGGVQYTSDERKIAQEDGLAAILPEQWLTVCDMADELSRHTLAMELLSDGRPELSGYAVDQDTGVMRRCRFDYFREDYPSDYKSAVSSEPREFVRQAARLGYHMQHPWYLDLARDLGHEPKGFVYIVQEKTPPYVVTVIELPPDLVEAGRERNRLALQRFRDCTASGLWPGYMPDDRIATAPTPAWALYDLEVSA